MNNFILLFSFELADWQLKRVNKLANVQVVTLVVFYYIENIVIGILLFCCVQNIERLSVVIPRIWKFGKIKHSAINPGSVLCYNTVS